MEDSLLNVRDMAMAAQNTADQAMLGINSHEQVCAERYENIKDRLKGIPRLFEILETSKKETTAAMNELRKWVYIGIGICTTVPIIIEIAQYMGGH